MGITVDELKDKRPDTTRILNEEKSNYKIISDSIKSLTTEKAVNNVETQKQITEGFANITNTKLQTEATRQLTDAYKEQNLVIRQKKLNDLADYLKEEGKQVKREIKDTEKQTRTAGDKAGGIVSLLGGKIGIAFTAITLALDAIKVPVRFRYLMEFHRGCVLSAERIDVSRKKTHKEAYNYFSQTYRLASWEATEKLPNSLG